MKEMHFLDTSIKIASEAHYGQLDKSGRPYILHALRVMFNVDSDEEKATAVLHDVIEDTFVTVESLLARGIPPVIVDAVVAVSRKSDEQYFDYIQRVKQNPIAVAVKVADIKDNLDPVRMIALSEEERIGMTKRYYKALKILTHLENL